MYGVTTVFSLGDDQAAGFELRERERRRRRSRRSCSWPAR
jgi:hypothetical protein